MKKVVMFMLITAVNANAMNVLISKAVPPGVLLSAIAHTSFAFGLFSNTPFKEVLISEVDGSLLPATGTSFAYLDTMVNGGNDVQVAETKKKERRELMALVKVCSADFIVPGSRDKEERQVQSEGKAGDKPENQPILYVVIRKNLTERSKIIARLAAELGQSLKKNADSILSFYEDKSGDVISLASKYPFMALVARNQTQVDELGAILKDRKYPHIVEDGAIAFMNMDGDRSITKKFSLAQ